MQTAERSVLLDRRRTMALLASAAVCGPSARAAADGGLRGRAAARGGLYGAAVTSRHIETRPELVAAIRTECGAVVPEFEMKWHAVEGTRGRRVLRGADRIVAFAAGEGLAVRGHTLLWPSKGKLPPWIEAWPDDDAHGLQATVDAHIADLAGRYRGRIVSWDVVNEAIEAKDGRADGLRRSVLLDRLGERYIDRAFELTRTHEPTARLIYNDYGVEHEIPWQVAKRGHVLGLLERLKARGVPIQGLGIQAHLRTDAPFDAAAFGSFLDRVGELGLLVEITELDVEDREGPADAAERDRQVAGLVRQFLDTCLARTSVVAVTTWGLSDATSWLADPRWGRKRQDGLPSRPLPLDASMERKPMWHAMDSAFAGAPRR